jgi:hypothetical protein
VSIFASVFLSVQHLCSCPFHSLIMEYSHSRWRHSQVPLVPNLTISESIAYMASFPCKHAERMLTSIHQPFTSVTSWVWVIFQMLVDEKTNPDGSSAYPNPNPTDEHSISNKSSELSVQSCRICKPIVKRVMRRSTMALK